MRLIACKGRNMNSKKPVPIEEMAGKAYCYMCTHTVDAVVIVQGLRAAVKPGQACPRCKASLDAGAVRELAMAA